MRKVIALSLIGLCFTACAGGMAETVTVDEEPASCKEGGNAMQCYQDLQRQSQAETGMTPQQQQQFMQQQMQGGMGGGMMMHQGTMPQGRMPVGQPGMMQPGAMPGMMPGMAPSGSAPHQPGEMTPQEEQEFLKKIEKLQQQQQTK